MPNANPLVVILTYDRLCTFEFGCAYEVFGLARPEMGPHWYRCLTAAGEPGPLRANGGLHVVPDGDLGLLDQADTIVIPGWRGPHEPAPAALLAALKRASMRGARLVGICGGSFVLAQAGLLDGRRATTHWRHLASLARQATAAVVEPDVLYIDEGNILTSAGSAAGLDLCLHLVRKDFGQKAANSVARRLVIAPHREGGQAQFVERSVPPPAGHRLAGLLAAVQARLHENWSVERMAATAHLSPRSLHRHVLGATGLTPGGWLQQQRIALARMLIEETDQSIETIAERAGFGTAANFRQHFRAATGLAPTAYRRSFGRRGS
ncbi:MULTISPECIES: transcriptional regulator FtrA [unclassified Sphingomonas]|uniref:transcriptional regulator FtrA n=1 Tax=Novosphingobium rhizosphaerae TaxID=1551649 RepID=UPI0015C8F9A6